MGVTRRGLDARGVFHAVGTAALVGIAGACGAGASAVPFPEGDRVVAVHDEVRALEALGLDERAEQVLRREVDAGHAWARGALVASMVRAKRPADAAALLESWGGAEHAALELPHFAQGIVEEGRGRWPQAAEAFVRAIERDTLLAAYAAEHAALALEEAERTEEAIGLAELAADLARTSELAARARWWSAQRALAREEPGRALENLRKIPERSTIARRDQLELEAKAHRALDDGENERAALRRAIEAAPASDVAVRAAQRLMELDPPTPSDRLAYAEIALESRHPVMAEREARAALAAVADSPDPLIEGRARLLLGRALARRNKLSNAREELTKLPTRAALADRAEAALERARCLWKLDRLDASLAEYDSLAASDAPEGVRVNALWEAARESKDARRWADAAARMDRFTTEFPSHELADDALWHGIRARLEIGDLDGAIGAETQLAARAPQSPFRDEAGYWIARALAQRNRVEESCARIRDLKTTVPDGYWTLRARAVAESLHCAAADTLPARSDSMSAWIDSAADSAIVSADEIRRAAELARWGLFDDAEQEIGELRRRHPGDRALLLAIARASVRIGVPRGGMQAVASLRQFAGGSVLGGTLAPEAARLLYPVAHVDDVLRWCDEYGMDPFFVYAVMREESWFDPEAVSSAGARGLLQIMPTTGADLARQVGMPKFHRADLFTPEVNIRLGTFYLRKLLERLDEEPTLALAAYNAGERNAERWKFETEAGVDVDRTVAGITFRETSDYVQRVSVTREIYRTLYEDEWPNLRKLRDAKTASN
jgi:soluble lytic murein transglycosylase